MGSNWQPWDSWQGKDTRQANNSQDLMMIIFSCGFCFRHDNASNWSWPSFKVAQIVIMKIIDVWSHLGAFPLWCGVESSLVYLYLRVIVPFTWTAKEQWVLMVFDAFVVCVFVHCQSVSVGFFPRTSATFDFQCLFLLLLSSCCFNVFSATLTSWIVAPYLLRVPYTSSECNFILKTGPYPLHRLVGRKLRHILASPILEARAADGSIPVREVGFSPLICDTD